MGTYDDLLNLQKTSTVAAQDTSKTVEPPAKAFMPPKPKKPVLNVATKPLAESMTNVVPEPSVFRKRIITRGSFEIYQDQIHVLRQVSLTAKLTGDDLSISEMVREALDEYIHRKDLHS